MFHTFLEGRRRTGSGKLQVVDQGRFAEQEKQLAFHSEQLD